MPRTLVVLPASGVLPADAGPALRAADHVLADATVPADLRDRLGALPAGPGEPPPGALVFTADPDSPLRDGADVVLGPPPGAALLDAVAVMDRLRSPGGCPWDAEQTHESLLQYLVEECYELYQAIEDRDRDALREELGDVLLQVLFHARLAAEGRPAFGIDDVAAELVAKLVGRHPHVFAAERIDGTIDSAERQEHRWEELKRAEKRRESSVDGVATAQPAVALAAKLTSRTARAGLPAALLPGAARVDGPDGPDGPGERLFALAAAAKLDGHDPEAQLRTVALRFAADVRAAETAARAAGLDPHALDAAAWRRFWPRPLPGPR